MGYRSSVHAIFYWPDEPEEATEKEKYALLKFLFDTTYKDLVEAWNQHGQCFCFHDDIHLVEFEVHDMKWYDTFSEVQGFEQMMDTLNDAGFAYEFVRTGEDDTDIEINRSGNAGYKLSVQTSSEIIA